MKKILEIDSSNDQARKVIRRLEPLSAEKLEKMKAEMIGELFLYVFHKEERFTKVHIICSSCLHKMRVSSHSPKKKNSAFSLTACILCLCVHFLLEVTYGH